MPSPYLSDSWWEHRYRGDYNDIPYEEVYRCRGRGHTRRGPGIFINAASVKTIIEHCLDCGEQTGGFQKTKGKDLSALPIARDNQRNPGSCVHPYTEIMGRTTTDGRTSWWNTCGVCLRHLKSVPMPPGGFLLYRIVDLRVDDEGFAIVAPCDHCHRHVGTQVHHWAPRALFEDPDSWATANLCVGCHAFWHKVVTPDISRRQAS